MGSGHVILNCLPAPLPHTPPPAPPPPPLDSPPSPLPPLPSCLLKGETL